MSGTCRRWLTAGLALLILLTLCFIWGNSLESRADSKEKSLGVLDRLRPLLELVVGKGNATDHLVRKLAHFTEFGALGGELALLLALRRRMGLQGLANCLFAGLCAAVTDEALQLLSDRGSQVQDVLLDFGGVFAGVAVVAVVAVMWRRRK